MTWLWGASPQFRVQLAELDGSRTIVVNESKSSSLSALLACIPSSPSARWNSSLSTLPELSLSSRKGQWFE